MQEEDRQGGALSLLIFIIDVDLLQSVFNEVKTNNLDRFPIDSTASVDPIIQYADETVLVRHACPAQLQHVQNLLMHFAAYIGLGVNYNKSLMVPTNVSDQMFQQLTTILGRVQGSLPFTYLGITLCLSKPRVEDFVPCMHGIENRHAGCYTFLSCGEKLHLITFVFTRFPTFFMCSLELPKIVLEQINKYLRHCF